jgi:hypothetical protein
VNTIVTIDDINISGNVQVNGTAQLKLLLSGTNTITGRITVAEQAKLTVDSATESGSENGSLSVKNNNNATYASYAVIGGQQNSGEGIINGGTIVATQAAGTNITGAVIGGGGGGTGNVTITGGNVTATLPGSYGDGAAIGGGISKSGTVNISGGIITATTYDHNFPSGGPNGAAIGGGKNGSCNINITGGVITATASNGAAIGNGSYGNFSTPRGTINISGATIAAYSVGGSGIGVGQGNPTHTVPTYNISNTADITALIKTQYTPGSGLSPICGIIGDGANQGNGYFVNLYRKAGQGESFQANTVYVFDTDMTLLRVIPVPEYFTPSGAFEWVSFTAGPVASPATNYKVYLDSGNGLYEIIRYDNHRHPGLNLPVHSVNQMKGYEVHEYLNPSEFILSNQLLMVNGKDFNYGIYWMVTEKYVDKYGNPIKGVSDKGEMIAPNNNYEKKSIDILYIPGYDYLGYKWFPFDGTYTSGTPKKQITSNDTIYFIYKCNLPPVIDGHPEVDEQTSCENSNGGLFSTPLNVIVVPEEGLTYQWYVNTIKSNSGGTEIVDATNSAYTPPNTVSGKYYYYCVVTGECGSATSNVSGIHIVTPSVKPEVKISVTVD